MVRNYVKKSNRRVTTPRKIKAAVELVKAGWSIRKACGAKNVNRETLRKAVIKVKDSPEVNLKVFEMSFSTRNIFPAKLEDEIAQYCIQVAQAGYGLTVQSCRELAFQVAQANDITMPPTWERDKMAGIEWFHGFQKRHREISIRIPEACSVARAMAFNKTNVNTFFDKLSVVRERHPSFSDGSRVFNLDETNTSTVQNVRRIISPKGVKQIHQVKGAERGVSVTTCIIISAHGSLLPPVHIFPRKKNIPDLLINAFPGALGLGNTKGYMTRESFVEVMKHFIKCTGSTKENPSLLMLDNVETHFSTTTLDLARENGVTIFTFPPHCTHKLQPLDVGFFGPFKVFYDQAITTYLANNPAKPPTISRVAGFVKDALCKAATPHNIIKSFEIAGIVPFNRNIFSEIDFIMASVTERPDPNVSESEAANNSNASVELQTAESSENIDDPVRTPLAPTELLTAAVPDPEQPTTSEVGRQNFIGPLDIRGLPKAKPTKVTRKPRRKGKYMIATDTPEKEEIMQREQEKTSKKMAVEERKRKREEKAATKAKEKNQVGKTKGNSKAARSRKHTKKIARKLSFESDEAAEADDVSDISSSDQSQTENLSVSNSCVFAPLTKEPTEGDYVLVAFKAGKESVHYVGKILSEKDSDGDMEISYLRKKVSRGNAVSFSLPPVPDLKSVNFNDVKVILPKPSSQATTKRQQGLITFNFDFSKVELR